MDLLGKRKDEAISPMVVDKRRGIVTPHAPLLLWTKSLGVEVGKDEGTLAQIGNLRRGLVPPRPARPGTDDATQYLQQQHYEPIR